MCGFAFRFGGLGLMLISSLMGLIEVGEANLGTFVAIPGEVFHLWQLLFLFLLGLAFFCWGLNLKIKPQD